MKNRFGGLLLMVLLMFSCSEDPGISAPPAPPLEPEPICEVGTSRNCRIEENVGVCQYGVSPCLGDSWGECEQSVFPSEEICDGLDNDCNGVPDEVKPQPCRPPGFEGLGLVYSHEDSNSICELGWLGCEDGVWGECEGYVGPENEVCDGVDNNCNGVVDTDVDYGACGETEEGICSIGTNVCVDGDLHCLGAVWPDFEMCDGLDNDCDGEVDEELSQLCSSACGLGEEICDAGSWVECSAALPQEEVCNGFDDDCDGEVDEGLECECLDGMIQACPSMPCGWGIQECDDGRWRDCVGDIPQDEICNNHDDNCNGVIDEDLRFTCYEGPEDTLGVGECFEGYAECLEGAWGACLDQVLPQDEICDGLDNDCDGIVDNLERRYESTDIVFVLDVSGSMCSDVEDLIEAIADYTLTLSGSDHYFGLVLHGYDSAGEYYLHTDVTDISSFILSIFEQGCTTGSVEPVYDVIYDLARADNELGVSWRPHATPVIIVIGDENPQTRRGVTTEDILLHTEVCELPGCNSVTNENWTDGDPLELFVITSPVYFRNYQTFVFGEGLRFYDINSESISVGLDLIFKELCVD